MKGCNLLRIQKFNKIGFTKNSRLQNRTLMIVAIVLAVFLSCLSLTNHVFWDDEASTAIFARNLLNTGELTAWDGVNLNGYGFGMQLDENLNNPYMPSLQYYIAAMGFKIFGPSTFGGRILFLLAGLLSLLALAFLVRHYFENRIPYYLPVLIAALSPAFLLYIRQCRYYSLAMLFTLTLLGVWAWDKPSKRSNTVTFFVGILATIGLWFSNYLNAAAALAMLPVFFIETRYRTRRKYIFLAAICLVSVFCCCYIYLVKNPSVIHFYPPDSDTGLKHYVTFFTLYMVCLGWFEFFPVPLVLIMLLPLFMQQLHHLRDLARRGQILFLCMIVTILVTTVLSPQTPIMRYVTPLILIGTIITSVCIVILWSLSRPFAVLIGGIAILTNIFTLSYIPNPRLTWGSTLISYIAEQTRDYKTGTEVLINYISTLPAGSNVLIYPLYMTYAPMFYVPTQHYCWQLKESKSIRLDLREKLPDYVFFERARPDYIISGPIPPDAIIEYFTNKCGKGAYQLIGYLDKDWHDFSRPEIPLHVFGPFLPKQQQRFAVIKATVR